MLQDSTRDGAVFAILASVAVFAGWRERQKHGFTTVTPAFALYFVLALMVGY